MVTPGLLAPAAALVLILLGVISVVGFNRLGRLTNQLGRARQQLDDALVGRREPAERLAQAATGRLPGPLADAVTAAAADVPGGQGPDRTAAENRLADALTALLGALDADPQLGPETDLAGLRAELAAAEEQVDTAQQLHGLAVEQYNESRRAFPQILVARPLGFAREQADDLRLATRPRS
jgi:hypothetical protein